MEMILRMVQSDYNPPNHTCEDICRNIRTTTRLSFQSRVRDTWETLFPQHLPCVKPQFENTMSSFIATHVRKT